MHSEPRYGQTNILVYLGICSLMGSLTVVSIKAIGIAIKLTLEGIIQLAYPQTWVFVAVAVVLVIIQLNYLNKVGCLQNCPENPNRKKGTIVDVELDDEDEDEDEDENEDLVRTSLGENQ
ncbi:hypothetical protein IFM89_006993 [Coptis chinensis]|uniref:Probable magnesium transporter n=1 Tax=Coptis chinensis TaxID=261450 RepID=A0A835M4K7_9MAGN|nr:hypothetical protein IFM89_006993 [Coptis chinensis]